MEDNKPTARYKDSGCSFVVEVQPDYDREETEGNKGSTDDMNAEITDQQALVHREEIPDDRSSGKRLSVRQAAGSLLPSLFAKYCRFRLREYPIVREHQYRFVTVGSVDIQSRLGQPELPLRQSGRI